MSEIERFEAAFCPACRRSCRITSKTATCPACGGVLQRRRPEPDLSAHLVEIAAEQERY
jgi:hypothetical protein